MPFGVRLRQEVHVGCANCPLSSITGGDPVCEKAGRIKPYDPEFKCPENRFDFRLAPQTIPGAVVVGANWSEAMAWVRRIKGMASSFAGAVLSGRATDEVIAQRQASCSACPDRLVKEDGRAYCNNPGGCGCPQSKLWPFSELDEKLTWAELMCPRQQKGFSNEA